MICRELKEKCLKRVYFNFLLYEVDSQFLDINSCNMNQIKYILNDLKPILHTTSFLNM